MDKLEGAFRGGFFRFGYGPHPVRTMLAVWVPSGFASGIVSGSRIDADRRQLIAPLSLGKSP